MDEFTESPVYTVFDCDGNFPCADCENLNCISGSNNPRRSLDGKKAIATGLFENAPNAQHLTQSEAETLMQSQEWTEPEHP